jgi:cell division protein FtsL
MGRQEFPQTETDVPVELTERRLVYNGEARRSVADANVQRNRPVRRRRRSPFNMIFILFVVSVVIVLYVWNKICVNRLAVEVSDLQSQYQKVMNVNEIIKADINKKSSLERIEKISVSQLNLTYPKEQPVWFEVDAADEHR